MKIGLIGRGYVGGAVERLIAPHHEIVSWDLSAGSDLPVSGLEECDVTVVCVSTALGALRHLGRVRLIGAVPPTDVTHVLADHHVLLQTSEVEGLSNSLLEAMAAGVVPVATPAGDTASLVAHDRNGLLFPPGDIAAAAAALQRLDADRDLMFLYGRRAWERTIDFAWESVEPRLRAALSDVEANGASSRAGRHPG